MRFAIYYTPPEHDPLTVTAARWLGRNAFTGESGMPPAAAGLGQAEIAYHTAAPRRYGFHATLKAPFRLASSQTEAGLAAALAGFCRSRAPLTLPRIELALLDGFLALVPAAPMRELEQLAADVVTTFDRFRAPLTEAEIERRNPHGLSPRQIGLLQRWGYPYVMDEFRFHMTLTGRLDAEEVPRVREAVETFFGPHLERPLEIGHLALFVEPEPGAPFTVRALHALGRQSDRKTA
jgi:putative phosphonate metabolism protein